MYKKRHGWTYRLIFIICIILIFYILLHGKLVNERPAISAKMKQSNETSSAAAVFSNESFNRTTLLRFTQFLNEKQPMYNRHLFSSERFNTCFVFQVHNRSEYLRYVISYLRDVSGISDTLLVFSHDLWSDEINKIVRSIDFAPVIQIFYPFSVQFFPDTFPGKDENDCPPEIAPELLVKVLECQGFLMRDYKAYKIRCNNAAYPDSYGHYRNADYVQIKHHWWWKMNFLFTHLNVLKNKSDVDVVLLEEDFCVLPDILHFLHLMRKTPICGKNSIIALGSTAKSAQLWYSHSMDQVYVQNNSLFANLGLTLNGRFWNKIREHYKVFCEIDEYNWDFSLVYIFANMFRELNLCIPVTTRVIHIGECGIHHQSNSCNVSELVYNLREKISKHRTKLFPPNISRFIRRLGPKHLTKLNGGWADVRDWNLCFANTFQNTTFHFDS